MSVTIKDVARLAGVSVATVSRVMNASAPVNDTTRQRVLDVARDLRFAPNGSARALSRRRTGALGVILPDLYGEFFSELLRGMDQAAQRGDHSLLVSSSHHDARGVAFAVQAMRGRVDGLLIMAPEVDPDGLADVMPAGMPTVLLNEANPRDDVHTLAVDNYGGAFAMTEHLLALGHRRVGFVSGAPANVDAREREKGFRAALRSAGVQFDESLTVRGNFSEQSGRRGAMALLALAERPSAIFAANDAMAVGALSALRHSGIKVPTDVAVVGFDDIPISAFIDPPLTTVSVGVAQLGMRAAELLLHLVRERPPPTAAPRREVRPATLIVRGSCGASKRAPSAVSLPSLAFEETFR